ncbi:MAG: hypothetical protein ACRDAU_07180 [Clostridium sp.]
MKNLYDFLSPCLQLDDSSHFSFEVIKFFSNNSTILLVDTFIKKSNYRKKLDLLGNKFEIITLNINRDTDDLKEIFRILYEKNFDTFTCFNNGLSIPKNLNNKYFIFLYSLFPLYEEKIKNLKYKDRYLKVVLNRVNNSTKTLIFSMVHYNLALSFGFKKEKLALVYPFIKSIYHHLDPLLAYTYIRTKFNISKFIFASGAINEAFNLKRVLSFFKKFKKLDKNIKLVIYAQSINKNYINLLDCPDILILKNITELDEVYFLNACIAVLDFSSQYIFNLTKIKTLFTNTILLTDFTPLNLEYFEDYPIYEDEAELSLEVIEYKKENLDLDSISNLKKKFDAEKNKQIILNLYQEDNNYE